MNPWIQYKCINMKSYFFLLMVLGSIHLPGCLSQGHVSSQRLNSFASYLTLADALRQEPGVLISGSGRNVEIRLSRAVGSARSLTYLLNGQEIGYDYCQVNESLDMNQVRSIRILRTLSELSRFGINTPNGAIEIWTE